MPLVPAGTNGAQHFRSRRDLQPPALTVTKNSAPASDGDFFIAAQFGPTQNGPMILDSRGNVVWFQPYPVSKNLLITDFRAQNLYGQPVLTWWQGNTNSGHGRGEGIIFNNSYRQIATVHAGNGLDEGLHEFLVTPNGDAYFTASYEISLPGVGKPTVDSVVQEVDIKTGLVKFEWHALDHVPTSASYFTPKSPGYTFDPYHVNSVTFDRSGNLLVSMRDTSAVYDVDHQNGAVIWTLGGKRSNFKMGSGTSTWGQHDAVMQPDGTITLFDDGGGPPTVRSARGIRERIDTTHMTATLIKEYDHSPKIPTNFEGSTQILPSGNVVLGWGQQPYLSEDNASGQQIFDAHFNVPTTSYRAYRFPWNAQPPTLPALAIGPNSDGSINLYASWNGATDVSSWRVLGGGSSSRCPARDRRQGRVRDPDHRAQCRVVLPGSGCRQLWPGAGRALPVSGTPAHLATLRPQRVCFRRWLRGRAGELLRRSRLPYQDDGHRRADGDRPHGKRANRSATDQACCTSSCRPPAADARPSPRRTAGRSDQRARLFPPTNNANLTLVRFSSSGKGPARNASQSPTLQFVGLTDFVSCGRSRRDPRRLCAALSPCHVKTTVSVGNTVVASTGSEFLGANELGYLTFWLTKAGEAMLARAPGNQLGATVRITNGSTTATGQLALVRFR